MVGPRIAVDGARPGPDLATSQRPNRSRRVLVVGAGLAGGVLAAAVLAGAMSDALTSRAAALEATTANALVAGRVAAGRQEMEFARTPAYLGFAARAFGYGHSSERVFALEAGSHPAPTITPLGSSTLSAPPRDALTSVLDLLFSR